MAFLISYRVFFVAYIFVVLGGTTVHANDYSECSFGNICRTNWELDWNLTVCDFLERDSPCVGTFLVECEAYKLGEIHNVSSLETVNGTLVSHCALFSENNITEELYNLTLICHENKISKCDFVNPVVDIIICVICVFAVFILCFACFRRDAYRKYIQNNRVSPEPSIHIIV
jgi:hypothetical protein